MKLLMSVRHVRDGLPWVPGGTLRSFRDQGTIRCLIAQMRGAAIRWRLLVFSILFRMTS
jgi:hypothetical protein